jgi:chemotaxis protein CheY-P-specific phosphatase CheC
MKKLDLNERTKFLNKIGPEIAREMTATLQKLTAEDIKVEFGGVQTFKQSKLLVDIGEKCFGSYVSFKDPEGAFEGIVVAVFSSSGSKILTDLLLKRFSNRNHEMKLSAFKETVAILVMTYVTEIANTLKLKLKTSAPKFVRFRNIEFARSALLRDYPENSVSVEQFRIGGEGKASSIKGRFIIVC